MYPQNKFVLFYEYLGFFRESNLQQCVKTVYGESATTGGLPQLSPQVTVLPNSIVTLKELQSWPKHLGHFVIFPKKQ